MRRPNHFNNRSNNAVVLPSSYGAANGGERTYSKYSKRSNNAALLTLAKLACAILIGYQIALMVHPNDAKFWKNNKPATSTLKQIYEFRNCGKPSSSKTLYFQAWWEKFYKTWKKHGGKGDPDFITSEAPSDFVPPTEPKDTNDGTGRGVFATRDIKKGEMIYGKTTNLAYFASGYSFQNFLKDLKTNEEACDFMKFSWPQSNFGPNGESAIVAIMDYHSVMKDGGEAVNCGCIRGKHCMVDEYALRDIKKGEQIHCSYNGDSSINDAINQEGWKEFGLL
eukprot:CAMPEP_0201690020 /NCGR_PEP_ID=MMETSP0578-20130828/3526_1 /ASSEMBLY_ACC=CAM_ASM_000663 /TAXON_ID=267565 /ORGANISM="Skeletonema grethea, Strain CCMP 1804" /LENGTH=279 /DNA_ID=CAMNT_0048174865 /DNA_START=30 /DNA_END=869 /DNA_ORIENTATION=-